MPVFDAVEGSTYRYASARKGVPLTHIGPRPVSRRYSAECCIAHRLSCYAGPRDKRCLGADKSTQEECRVVRPVMQTGTSKPPTIRPSKRRPSDTLTRQASNELVKLFRKLRWLGMEEEAQDLEDELRRRHAAAADSVLATAAETD
jgi:hypothetical protein